MRQKILQFFFPIILLFIFPAITYSAEDNLTFSADIVTVKEDSILYAEGNVKLAYERILVNAHSMTYDRDSNKLYLEEILEFRDDGVTQFSAKSGQLDADLKEGIIKAAKIILNEKIKIYADNFNLKNGTIDEAKGIWRVTSCDECQDKQPNWHLTASSAKMDSENENIIYRNVSLRVKGVPVFYFPYLRLPDPSVNRATGFLIPEAAITSNLATGIKLPYFVPLGPSRDLLLTPYFSAKTKTLEYRYRQIFRNGNMNIVGAFSSDDIKQNKVRFYNQVNGIFDLGYGINLSLDLGYVDDETYLGDYAYGAKSDLSSQLAINRTLIGRQRFFKGQLSYVRNKTDISALDEYYSISGEFIKSISQNFLPGRLNLGARIDSSLNVDNDNNFSRPPSSVQIGVNYSQVNKLGRSIILSNDSYIKLKSFVNSQNITTVDEEFIFQYGFSSELSLPLIKKDQDKTQILSPRFALSFNEQENKIAGEYFIGSDELSFGNIYSSNKITSLSESEKEIGLSAGIDYRAIYYNADKLYFGIGLSKISGTTYDPTYQNGLNNKKPNFVTEASLQKRNGLKLFGNALISDSGKILKGNLKANQTVKNLPH